MPRKVFDREIGQLIEKMKEMGDAVEDRLSRTADALKTLDRQEAREIADSDSEIDKQEQEIEKMCLSLIALQQPIAGDLRVIAGCLKILTDIERVADQCADVCEILSGTELEINSLALSHVARMLELASEMFLRAINVFISRDSEQAKRVCADDDAVDSLFSQIVLEVCGIITETPQNVMSEVDLIFIAKYVERIADHATNIAEWVIYMETGEHPDLNAKES